jgi:hypothetical protein
MSDNPSLQTLFAYLGRQMNARRLRLFACACCRHVWPRLTDVRSRCAVDVAEQFADGAVEPDVLARAEQQATEAAQACSPESATAAWLACGSAHPSTSGTLILTTRRAWTDKLVAPDKLMGLARDLFGHPFRPVVIEPAWLAWNGGTVARLAEAIYVNRDFDRLPILADALEEAGCADADLLQHCRSREEHARGCWAVDAILGK